MIGRRRLAALLGASLLAVPARADDFPTKPITLVVPFTPGGSIDMLARLVAQQASATLGQPIVIDNRSGAGGLIAAAAVAKAEPDGYTLLMASAAQVTIPPWINRSLSFDPPRDLVPVAHLADTPMVLIVSASSKAQTVGDFVAMARANRGGLNYGSTGVGTISQPGHGEPEARGRHRCRARALSRRRAGAGRPACGPGAGDVHQHAPRPRPWWRRAGSGRWP